MKDDEVQSSNSDEEPDHLPLTRLRPNRNRPMLCDTSFRSTGRPTRNRRPYPSRLTEHETTFTPRSPPTFRPRNNRRATKDIGLWHNE